MSTELNFDTAFVSEQASKNLLELTDRYKKQAHLSESNNTDAPDSDFDRFDCDASQHLVSVIIPTHNRKHMLKEAVDSVLMQTNCGVEVIIVDDCSSDGTPEFVKEQYGGLDNVHYFRNETSLGPGKARQKGYRASKGDYVTFLDDDDLYIEPSFFETAVKRHEFHKTCAFVCGNTFYFYQNTASLKKHNLKHRGFIKGEDYFNGFSISYKKPLSSFPSIFKRSVLDEADFTNMEMMNDASIYLRAVCLGDVFIMDDYIGAYRVHGSNISKGIDLDFLIGNIDEKYNIYLFSKQFKRNAGDEWLRKQVGISVRYYLAGNDKNKKSSRTLIDWCKTHPDFKMEWMLKEILRSKLLPLKKKVYRILKRK